MIILIFLFYQFLIFYLKKTSSPGTYNPNIKKGVCDDCPIGFYCDEPGLFNIDKKFCPRGYICKEKRLISFSQQCTEVKKKNYFKIQFYFSFKYNYFYKLIYKKKKKN